MLRMVKKLSVVLLILALAVINFTGCGSSSGSGGGDDHTSLEGTWRLTKETGNYTEDAPEWIEYPIQDSGAIIYVYIQLKDNKYAQFIKTTDSGKTTIEKSEEGTYKVEGDKIIIDFASEEIPEEFTFTISGERIMVVSGDDAYEAIRVSDSEVAGAE